MFLIHIDLQGGAPGTELAAVLGCPDPDEFADCQVELLQVLADLAAHGRRALKAPPPVGPIYKVVALSVRAERDGVPHPLYTHTILYDELPHSVFQVLHASLTRVIGQGRCALHKRP